MNIIPPIEIVFGEVIDLIQADDGKQTEIQKQIISLIDLYVSSWDFDENFYLSTYPDVASAVAEGVIDCGWRHFRRHGYLEGRLPVSISVDEDWYLSTYADVARAVLSGEAASARSHYERFGRAEGRLPRKPSISPEWYGRRYLSQSTAKVTIRACEEHFIKVGYKSGAIPHRPK